MRGRGSCGDQRVGIGNLLGGNNKLAPGTLVTSLPVFGNPAGQASPAKGLSTWLVLCARVRVLTCDNAME